MDGGKRRNKSKTKNKSKSKTKTKSKNKKSKRGSSKPDLTPEEIEALRALKARVNSGTFVGLGGGLGGGRVGKTEREREGRRV